MDIDRRMVVLRVAAAAVVLLVVPLVAVLASLNDEAPIRAGEESPRTVTSNRPIEVRDDEATREAQLAAEQSVSPVRVADPEARPAALQAARDVFTAARAARQPVEVPGPGTGAGGANPSTTTQVPTDEAQLVTLQAQVEVLDEDGLRQLVELSDAQLQRVETETLDLLQELLRPSITEDELDDYLAAELPVELSLVSWPADSEVLVVEPLVREVMRPTERIDREQTEARRQAAVDAVDPVFERWSDGDEVVEAGEVVTQVQFQALDALGEAGFEPGVAYARAVAAVLLVLAVFALYLRRAPNRVWNDPSRLFVLSATVVLAAITLGAVEALADADAFGAGWWFAFPAGGLVLLVSVLTSPQVGLVTVLPFAGISLLLAPSVPGLAIFVTAVTVLAAPMADRVTTRSGLRKASLRVATATPVVAVVVATVFGPRDQVAEVLLAAVVGGVVGAGMLQGLLPAFESAFRLATVTALLDLADRNHPLLRELEQKAIGSYNHSVMVASLTERCCREIGADHLLGQVAALYHDIGKVRQPHFFIENQRGIRNPHDDLEPRVSAVIIQNHVRDGVEMAEEHRLPPEVVSCIGSHHGTMKVTYFYNQAVEQAGGDEAAVDEQHFRYDGHKPRSKEAAVLLLADCCEATTRAMAMDRGTLPRDLIDSTVDRLLRERIEDGQFEECDLTFVELQHVRDTIVEALTGIYHPRIAYPQRRQPAADSRVASRS